MIFNNYITQILRMHVRLTLKNRSFESKRAASIGLYLKYFGSKYLPDFPANIHIRIIFYDIIV